jgi:hypothetical protein
MRKETIFLIIGIILILVGGVAYVFVQQPFTNCPSFMRLAVGVIPQNILDEYQTSGDLQILGSVSFVVGIGFSTELRQSVGRSKDNGMNSLLFD